MKRYLENYISRGRNNLLLFCTVLLTVIGTGCTSKGEPGKDVLARYGGNQLLREEIDFFLPDHVEGDDSARYAKQYIEKWVRNQAIVEEAKKEIEGLDEQLKYSLKNYEAELVANEFASHLIETNSKKFKVTDADILNYYTKYPERFVSSSNFYQFFYLKTNLPNQYRLKTLMGSDEPEKIEELRDWEKDNATESRLDSSYVQDSELERISKGFYEGSIEKARKKRVYYYGTSEGGQSYFHFFRMLHVVKPGDQLPLRICRERIINSIKNQTMKSLIQQTEVSLIQSARKSNKITISDE